MATRKSDNSGVVDPALPQKKKARRRLIGAVAICVAAAIVLPLVLDSEPRRVRDEVQVQIPSRDTPLTEPLPGARDAPGPAPSAKDAAAGSTASGEVAKPDAAAAPAPSEAAAAAPSPAVQPPQSPAKAAPASPAARADAKTAPRADAKADAKAAATAAGKPDAKPAEDKLAQIIESRTAPRADEAATGDARPAPDGDDKPAARPDAKPAEPAKAGGYQLQLGAFSDEKGAARMMAWARKAGVATHTEKVSTKNGDRIRVRAGPFATRAEAERARTKLAQSHVEATLVGP